jgi:RNA recognition motif-containing protein
VEIPSKVITKNPDKPITRHLGFAFAQFKTKEDADKAIEQFNGKKFQRRTIFIKKAVPPPTEEEKAARIEQFKAKKEAYSAEKQKKLEQKEKKQATAKTDEPSNERDEIQNDKGEKVPDGKPSTDTIFITNLDYRVSVKTLSSIFKDLKPKWIHVPTKKVPYHVLNKQKNRRVLNKGIGFVKFSSEEIQKKAVAEFNGKEINGRPIIVDIAVDTRIPKDAEEES